MNINERFLEEIQTACANSPQVAVNMMADTLITLSAMANEEISLEISLGSLSVIPKHNLSEQKFIK